MWLNFSGRISRGKKGKPWNRDAKAHLFPEFFDFSKVFSIFLCLCYHLHVQQSISCIQTSYAKGKSDRDFSTSLRCSKVRKTSNISSIWDQMHPGFTIRFGFSGPGCALCPPPDSWPWLDFLQLFSFLRHTYLLRPLIYFRHHLWISVITPMISASCWWIAQSWTHSSMSSVCSNIFNDLHVPPLEAEWEPTS